jgi:hypothetical protein
VGRDKHFCDKAFIDQVTSFNDQVTSFNDQVTPDARPRYDKWVSARTKKGTDAQKRYKSKCVGIFAL